MPGGASTATQSGDADTPSTVRAGSREYTPAAQPPPCPLPKGVRKLPLELRPEFRSACMRGTAIELRNKQNTGWAQRDPGELLRISYPSADVQRSLEAISKSSGDRPILLKGQRGRGKSHIMALLHHAFRSPEAVETWAREWAPRLEAQRLDARRLATLQLRRGLLPLTETLSDQEYPNLWDVIFDLHPRGPVRRLPLDRQRVSVLWYPEVTRERLRRTVLALCPSFSAVSATDQPWRSRARAGRSVLRCLCKKSSHSSW